MVKFCKECAESAEKVIVLEVELFKRVAGNFAESLQVLKMFFIQHLKLNCQHIKSIQRISYELSACTHWYLEPGIRKQTTHALHDLSTYTIFD